MWHLPQHPDIYAVALMHTPHEKKFSARCDLWSLGVTLYHTAAGDLPFRPFGGKKNRETMYVFVCTTISYRRIPPWHLWYYRIYHDTCDTIVYYHTMTLVILSHTTMILVILSHTTMTLVILSHTTMTLVILSYTTMALVIQLYTTMMLLILLYRTITFVILSYHDTCDTIVYYHNTLSSCKSTA